MISYSDQTFSIYSQFPAFSKSCWCIFFLFVLFLVFLRPRNCSEHWVIFLFLSILFAKSRLSFNLLQGKEAKYIFLKKDSMFLLKPCVIPSCLCQIFFFWLSRDFFPLLSVLISVFLCQYPWTLLFPGTFSDSPSGDPTNLWAASASPTLAWLWHYQHHLSVKEKSKKRQAAGKVITDL